VPIPLGRAGRADGDEVSTDSKGQECMAAWDHRSHHTFISRGTRTRTHGQIFVSAEFATRRFCLHCATHICKVCRLATSSIQSLGNNKTREGNGRARVLDTGREGEETKGHFFHVVLLPSIHPYPFGDCARATRARTTRRQRASLPHLSSKLRRSNQPS
jgi:hypothetical protein